MNGIQLGGSQRGLSLVELMVAMALGLLVMYGILTLFSGVSRSNDLQAALARVQESGRFAVTTLEKDLRMASVRYCANTAGYALQDRQRPMWSTHGIRVEAPSLGTNGLYDTGGMRSVDNAGNRSTALATLAYSLSTRFMLQAHNCTTGNTCTPALPATGIFPSAGTGVNQRVPNSDILTIRYLSGTGWDFRKTSLGPLGCVSNSILQLQPKAGDDPVTPASVGMIASCRGGGIFPIAGINGNEVQIGPKLSAEDLCGDQEDSARLFDFERDFITVSYYLVFRQNENPDARPNAGTRSLTPTLVRRVNGGVANAGFGGSEQDVVRGVDQMAFRFGVLDNNGNLRMLTATQVNSRLGGSIACTPKALGVAPSPDQPSVPEPGCLWRAVSRIETHLLVNSENEARALDQASASFRFLDVEYAPRENDLLPNQLRAGSMPRREFISQVSARNFNP